MGLDLILEVPVVEDGAIISNNTRLTVSAILIKFFSDGFITSLPYLVFIVYRFLPFIALIFEFSHELNDFILLQPDPVNSGVCFTVFLLDIS